jgi:hypothetical protein
VERVSFLVESSGVRLPCLLNPETLVVRRVAGVRPRPSAAGLLTGAGLTDDPLLHTGGGRTELDLDLLFDVTLAGATGEDVRDLTTPLWNMAENAAASGGPEQSAQVRFVWGKSWNFPSVVVAVAERLENFTPAGVARRSWLRLRLWRVNETRPRGGVADLGSPAPPPPREVLAGLPPDAYSVRQVNSGTGPAGGERMDTFLARNRIPPQQWKAVADLNGIQDPLRLPAATPLRLPPPGMLGGDR